MFWLFFVYKEHLLPSVGEFVKGVSGDDVAADELHGWVALRRLLPQDGTRKHWVIPALFAQVYLDLHTDTHKYQLCYFNGQPCWDLDPELNMREHRSGQVVLTQAWFNEKKGLCVCVRKTHRQLILVCPDATTLPLLDDLLNVHQHRQGHATWRKTETHTHTIMNTILITKSHFRSYWFKVSPV